MPSAVISRRMRSSPKRIPNSSSDEQVALGSLGGHAVGSGERPPGTRELVTSDSPRPQALELVALGLDDGAAAPWRRSPRWPACPRRARSPPRAWPARGEPALGAPRSTRRGQDLDRPARDRDRRDGSRPVAPCRPAAPGAPRARRLVVAVGVQPRRDASRGLTPASSRQPRSACTASITRADAASASSSSAPRRLGRTGAAASSPSAPGSSAQISSVTNGITGWASASVSPARGAVLAARLAARQPRLDQLEVPVAELAVDEVVEASAAWRSRSPRSAGDLCPGALKAREDPAVLDRRRRRARRAPSAPHAAGGSGATRSTACW